MTAPHPPQNRRRYLLALAIIVFIASGAAFIYGWNNYVLRGMALLGAAAGLYIVRTASARNHSPAPTNADLAERGTAGRPRRLIWIGLGLVSVASLGLAYLCLYSDAVHGYQAVLPVYVFAGVALFCGVFWPYVLLKMR